MKAALVFVVATLVLGSTDAGNWLRVKQRRDNEAWLASADYAQQEDNQGFSAGSELRSIAHGSASRAYTAVANQYAAAQQASYIAQNNLAQEAFQAAATAQAALAGKSVLYKDLEKQVEDAQEALDAEEKQLKLAEKTAEAAKEVAETADEQINSLEEALKSAKTAAEQARSAAGEAAAELASQSSMVGTAQERLNDLASQWRSAEVDYEATKQAAVKAAASAQVAREIASQARQYTGQKLQESPLNNEEESNAKYETPGLWQYRHRQ